MAARLDGGPGIEVGVAVIRTATVCSLVRYGGRNACDLAVADNGVVKRLGSARAPSAAVLAARASGGPIQIGACGGHGGAPGRPLAAGYPPRRGVQKMGF